MMEAIQILKSEHRSITAVLHGLKELARMAQSATVRPDFRVLRSMIRYIDEYPERLHHPKEDRFLFARLLMRAPEAKPVETEIEDPNSALSLRETGKIRPLGDLYSVAEKELAGEVIDAKLVSTVREGWTYDLRVVTRVGLVRQARYDAATLALRSLDGQPVE